MGIVSIFIFLGYEFDIGEKESMNIDNLGFFYLTLAILALALAIVAYPSLRQRSRNKKK